MKYFFAFCLLISVFTFYGCKKSHPVEPPVDTIEEIKIGNQIWMLKNLDVDHYRNGDSIPEVRDSATWVNLNTGAWCYYINTDSLGKIYGKLYNWYAVNDPRGLAPVGWHVPADTEWTILTTYLGGQFVAGDKLRETGSKDWISPNKGATNESGFSALPGGLRSFVNGQFYGIGSNGDWWTATESDVETARSRHLFYSSANIIIHTRYYKGNGFTVRCVRNRVSI